MCDYLYSHHWFWIFRKVLEAARDLLKQCQEGALTSLYFYDLSERLERLLFEVQTILLTCLHCSGAADCAGYIHKLFLSLSSYMYDTGTLCLWQAHQKTDQDVSPVKKLVRKMLMIMSRPARLLECLVSSLHFVIMYWENKGCLRQNHGQRLSSMPTILISEWHSGWPTYITDQ